MVQSTSYILRKDREEDYIGEFIRLIDYKTSIKKEQKTIEAIKNTKCGYRYSTKTSNFDKIPGSPIAYWVSEKAIFNFKYKKMNDCVNAVKGLDTCDNDQFVREWYEVDYNKIGLDIHSTNETHNHKWYPYCKGGGYKKWYGLNEKVVLWENDGKVLRNLRNESGKIKSRPQNTKYYFKNGLTFSTITSNKFSS